MGSVASNPFFDEPDEHRTEKMNTFDAVILFILSWSTEYCKCKNTNDLNTYYITIGKLSKYKQIPKNKNIDFKLTSTFLLSKNTKLNTIRSRIQQIGKQLF